MNTASSTTFDSAEREYNEACSAPSSTRFELAPIDVNKTLKERYRVSPERTLTRTMIWDMETKKAWDPLSYIPYVVSQARSWGRTTLRDGTTRLGAAIASSPQSRCRATRTERGAACTAASPVFALSRN
jgi:hypothetical protein